MAQYQSDKTPTTAAAPVDHKIVQDRNTLERNIKSLEQRVNQQATELQEIEQKLKKLQNEVRAAVNAFNLTNRG